MDKTLLSVQVCFATPTSQDRIALQVPAGTTIAAAVGMAMPQIDLTAHRVGIYGKLKTLDTVLRDQDRVEVYRPLLADPKESRRRRARA